MLRIIRTISNNKANKLSTQVIDNFTDLTHAIDTFEELHRADKARYEAIINSGFTGYIDNIHQGYMYFYAIGNTEIQCVLEGVYEDACKTFYIEPDASSTILSTDIIKNICKINCGQDCCRYLVCDSQGFSCGKKGPLKGIIDSKIDYMVAKGDNCKGV